MLKAIQYYTPSPSSVSKWWFGGTNDRRGSVHKAKDTEHKAGEDGKISKGKDEDDEKQGDGDLGNSQIRNDQELFQTTTNNLNIENDNDEMTGSKKTTDQFNQCVGESYTEYDENSVGEQPVSTRKRLPVLPKVEGGLTIDSFKNTKQQFPLSSDDEYRTCNELADVSNTDDVVDVGYLLNTNYVLDDRVRQIILGGLSETNDEEDDLPSRRWSRQQPLLRRRLSHQSALQSADGRVTVRQNLLIRDMHHIQEYTDSDSSFLEASAKSRNDHKINKLSSMLFPFSLIFDKSKNSSKSKKKNLSPKKRRRAATTSTSSGERQAIMLRVKSKSYGTSEEDEGRTLLSSGNQARICSIQRIRDSTDNDDFDSPVVTVNTDFLSASYSSVQHLSRNNSISSKRKSISEFSYCSLASSWSEYTISLEVGCECKEIEGELLTTPNDDDVADQQQQLVHYLHGHNVKEIFLDDECYCCQCTIM